MTGVGNVTVSGITTSGSAGVGTNQSGANAGTVAVTSTGTPKIIMGGDILAQGGNATGTGTAGNGATITLTGPVELTGTRAWNSSGGTGTTAGTGGLISTTSTIDSNGTARALTITSGTGNIDIAGGIGQTSGLSTLTVAAANLARFNSPLRATTYALTGSTIRFHGDVTATTDDVTITGNLELAGGDRTITTGLSTNDNFSVSGTTTAVGGTPLGLTVNAGTGTAAVGIVGADTSIARLSSTAATTTLNGNITTADVANNNVSR